MINMLIEGALLCAIVAAFTVVFVAVVIAGYWS